MIPFGFFKTTSSGGSTPTYIDVTSTESSAYSTGTYEFKSLIGSWTRMNIYFNTPTQFSGSIYQSNDGINYTLVSTYSAVWSVPYYNCGTTSPKYIKIVVTAGSITIRNAEW